LARRLYRDQASPFSTFRPRIHLNSSTLAVTIVNGRGVSTDQEVICTDWSSGVFQCRTDSAIFGMSGNIERQNLDLSEQVLDGFEQALWIFLGAAIAQLSRDDDASANIVLTNTGDTFCGFALGILDQVGDNVRVQHVAGQNTFSAAGGRSSISGKSSSSGFIVASWAISPRLRSGSITIAVTMHDGFVARQFEFHRDPHGLVAAISE
jgi:hypothetical protein